MSGGKSLGKPKSYLWSSQDSVLLLSKSYLTTLENIIILYYYFNKD